jgi:hypothetical protein
MAKLFIYTDDSNAKESDLIDLLKDESDGLFIASTQEGLLKQLEDAEWDNIEDGTVFEVELSVEKIFEIENSPSFKEVEDGDEEEDDDSGCGCGV